MLGSLQHLSTSITTNIAKISIKFMLRNQTFDWHDSSHHLFLIRNDLILDQMTQLSNYLFSKYTEIEPYHKTYSRLQLLPCIQHYLLYFRPFQKKSFQQLYIHHHIRFTHSWAVNGEIEKIYTIHGRCK